MTSALLDAALATVVTVLTLAGALDSATRQPEARDLDLRGLGLLVLAAVAVAGIRRAPLVVLAVVTCAHAAYTLFGYPEGIEWLPVVVAIAGTAAAGFRWTAVLVSLVEFAWAWGSRVIDSSAAWVDAELLLVATGIGSALLAGEWIRARRAYVASAEQRARLAELTKEEEARRRVDEERLRIAREMHDVLAHSLASINVQAGVTLHVLHKHPEQAEEALGSIKAASAEALEELRATVGALRDTGPPSARRLDRLDTLVEPARKAGLRVRVHTNGEHGDLPAHLDLAVYRILQESITNAIRYAGPATLTITLDNEPARLVLRVADDGRGVPPAGASKGTGKGIAGMRERATSLGGTLEAGPLPGRGFAVTAVIPTPRTAT